MFVLVNDKNAVIAAKEAAGLRETQPAEVRVHVLPTPDIVAGIAALFAMRRSAEGAPVPSPEQILPAALAYVAVRRCSLRGRMQRLVERAWLRGKPAASCERRRVKKTLYAGGTLREAAACCAQCDGRPRRRA